MESSKKMLCLKDYEEYAEKHLEHRTWAFFSQGAERDWTLNENLLSYTRYTFIPRMLLNPPERDLSTTILGHKISIPIGLAPTAYQRLAHPDGEIAASKAAEEMRTVYTLSTVSNTSLEDVARSVPNRSSPLFMQLYMARIRSCNEDLIRKAEVNGYKAIVLTVDTPVVGLQLKMWKAGGIQMPPHLSVPNAIDAIRTLSKDGSIPNHVDLQRNLFTCNITWEDVKWIKSITKLPLVLKGIITAEDAKKASEYGVAAVWVSNHGGRQLDGVSSVIDVLPEIVAALKGTDVEVYADGGVRWGSDVLKLLAMGAKVVFIGRPLIWGLAHSGQEGVQNILQILKSELDRAMHLAGVRDVKEVGPHLLRRRHCCKM
ncbi:2-Hydroxyacid oxidase 1 [Parasteatoda tepidariorum]|uniref:2-Hydroxyacid oxidase 1 n=1 Tax=Parasteatoda tepidariorum TaxID=114398 RepID=UPI001C7200E2|nr:hydroxyacid oxidase 1 [Parasteatoda tepidariorum]XP_042899888.1 hydroxyacid oxidase 1 [Parasteatoda tepidariorum]XP_042899891.1 hydroxyacid oxidase 1 [Parasteatoda tepidariorum]